MEPHACCCLLRAHHRTASSGMASRSPALSQQPCSARHRAALLSCASTGRLQLAIACWSGSPIAPLRPRRACTGWGTVAAARPPSGAAPEAELAPPPSPAPAPSPQQALFVAWDLDNIPVAHLAHLALVGRRLVAAAQQHLLAPSEHPQPATCQLTAYANRRTLARLAGEGSASGGAEEAAARVLALVGGRLVPVPTRRNAADSAMRSDIAAWAAQHGPAAVVACVSGDQGFAGVLRYASATRGATVAAVTDPLKTRKRPPWAPPPNYGRYPLPAAAGICLAWDAARLPDSQEQLQEEAALLSRWAAEGAVPHAPPCPGGVAAVWRQQQQAAPQGS